MRTLQALISSMFVSIILVACGGGSSGNNSENNSGGNTSGSSDVNTGQVENHLSAATVEPDVSYAVAGAGSGKTCSSALSASRAVTTRQISACKLAELAFLDATRITFNTDYEATGSDYLSSSSMHTGIDLQGHPKPSNSRIAAILPGTVVGINEAYGGVIVQSSLTDGQSIQVGYLHLIGIAVTKGQVISRGTVLGLEGGKGPSGPNAFAPHLHIEVRSVAMSPSAVLATAPTAASWTYALDPLSHADQILAMALGEPDPDAGPTPVPAAPDTLSPGTLASPGPLLDPSSLALSWGDSLNALSYEVGVRDLDANTLFSQQSVTSSNLILPALKSATRYRWNVRACNDAGCSPYTSLRYFQTQAQKTVGHTCLGTDGAVYQPDQPETIACPSGQDGSQSHTCQADGNWGPTTGVCKSPVTCTGTDGQSYPSGGTEQLTCPSGQTGSPSHTCLASGSWGPTTGVCTAPTTCLGNDGQSYPVGGAESLTCPSGQTGSPYRTCQSNGSWGATTGVCTAPTTCVGNDGQSYPVGGAEYLTCPSGQTGSPYHTCLASGSWGATLGTACTTPTIALTGASKTGSLARNFRCASGATTCVQAGVTLLGRNLSGFDSIKVSWSGSTGSGNYTFSSSSSQITTRTDTSIVIWPTVFDGTDPVGTCATWTFQITKAGISTSSLSLSTGPICRPSGV